MHAEMHAKMHATMGFLTGQWLAQTLLEHTIDTPNVSLVWVSGASEISQQPGFGVLDGFASVSGIAVNIGHEIVHEIGHEGYANF